MTDAGSTLAAELASATEAAAVAAARLVGSGDGMAIDRAAVDAMRSALSVVDIDGAIAIGEGEKDAAPMLGRGERVGTGHGPEVDLAVDPVDGTSAVAAGSGGAITALAAAPRGSLLAPTLVYMDRVVVAAGAAGRIDLTAPVADTMAAVALALGKRIPELEVAVLDRPRNRDTIASVEGAGARLTRLAHADLGASVAAAMPGRGPDLLLGVGGAPETVVAACAVLACGGDMQCQPWPRHDADRQLAAEHAIDLDQVLGLSDVVSASRAWFAASGVTDGELLRGADLASAPPRVHTLTLASP